MLAWAVPERGQSSSLHHHLLLRLLPDGGSAAELESLLTTTLIQPELLAWPGQPGLGRLLGLREWRGRTELGRMPEWPACRAAPPGRTGDDAGYGQAKPADRVPVTSA